MSTCPKRETTLKVEDIVSACGDTRITRVGLTTVLI